MRAGEIYLFNDELWMPIVVEDSWGAARVLKFSPAGLYTHWQSIHFVETLRRLL